MTTIIKGKNNITVELIADSISPDGDRMSTFEIQLPKVLLAELNTHRALSKNFQSSRAVPTMKMNEIQSFEPIYYGKNQPGMMSKKEEIDNTFYAKYIWSAAIALSKNSSKQLIDLGLHKQWSNRLNDWHVMAKGVISGTDWDNMLWLRNDGEAQPEFEELAKCMQLAFDQNTPNKLQPGEWHLPYIRTYREPTVAGNLVYQDSDGAKLSVDDAKKISASCCAQVSYRKLNDSKVKALEIYNRLFTGRKPHLSPCEQQATPIKPYNVESNNPFMPVTWEPGVTHLRKDGKFCSGNIAGWIQYRQTLPNNVYVKV